jgi:RNA polymerase sigma-70 factor (ECF subfamily)
MVAALAIQKTTTGEARKGRLPERREAQLVRAAQRGSEAALEELFNRHWPPAHRLAYLIVHDAAAAEDIAQEAFLAAVRALDRFDRRRRFSPWLHRIVANRAIDWARARALRRETGVGEAEAALSPDPDPGYSDDLAGALAALSLDRRTVVVLRYLLDYTPGEIARLLGVPRGTVNSRLRRGLDELAAVVESEE